MRILTNPGSNLSAKVVAAYEIVLAPQTLVVDDVRHDTRVPMSLGALTQEITRAKAHPHIIGSTAAETIEMCRDLAKADPSILLLTSSRKIVQTHAASVTAKRLLSSQPATRNLEIAIVDSTVTDVGTALACILAGECRRAGLDLAATSAVLDRFAATLQFTVVPATLDYLVAGGRAGILRARIADWLDRVPMLGFVDGDLENVGLVSSKKPPDDELVQRMTSLLGKGRPVWAAIGHGDAPEVVPALAKLLRQSFDVRFLYVMPMTAGSYIHLGRGSRMLAVGAVDQLGRAMGTPVVATG